MKLLINTSNIKKSGALQVSLSFLQEIRHMSDHRFVVVISDAVNTELNRKEYGANVVFYHLSLVLPFKRGRNEYLQQMNNIVQQEQPDCVFSVFGPTYWTPAVPHVAGFAFPWMINPDSSYIQTLPFKKRLMLLLENTFKKYYFKKEATQYVVETEDVKRRLSKYVGISKDKIEVVNNTCNHFFSEAFIAQRTTLTIPGRQLNEFRLVTISSNFSHKNLGIITAVLEALKKKEEHQVFFYLTISDDDYSTLFTTKTPHIINLNSIPASACPSVYEQCDALFLPTLLECFSASYPEAMTMGKPIITSDLDFAHAVCQDAALYINPFDADDIADAIIRLKNNQSLYKELVAKGIEQVQQFPSAKERAKQYIRVCATACSR